MKQTEETLCTFINTWHARSDSTGCSSCLPAEKGQHRSRQDTKASSRLVLCPGQAALERGAGPGPVPWSRGDL